VQFTKDAAARYSSAATAAAMQYHGIAYQYNYTVQRQGSSNNSTTKNTSMMKLPGVLQLDFFNCIHAPTVSHVFA
jgi:hypothetical protein